MNFLLLGERGVYIYMYIYVCVCVCVCVCDFVEFLTVSEKRKIQFPTQNILTPTKRNNKKLPPDLK